MPTILLVRHAQASFGATDYDVLSERGHAQIAALLAALERRGIVPGRVVCGTVRRQRDTADPCAAAAGVTVALDERWNEYDDADILSHHSTSSARVHRRQNEDAPAVSSGRFQEILNVALHRWIAAGAASPCRQSWPRFHELVTGALDDEVRGLGASGPTIVVTSSGVIAALAASLLALPPDAFVTLNNVGVNTAITKLVIGRSGTTLVSYNEHAHLEEAGRELITYR